MHRLILTILLTLCLPALQASAGASARPQLVDRVVAVIEDEIITLRELEALAAPRLAQQKPDAPPSVRAKILAEILDTEIGERMLLREIVANRDRLAVSDKDIDHAIEEIARLNHVDQAQLQQALFAQGMSLEEYRKKMRSQLERTRLIQFKVQGRVQIKDIDVLRRCKERQRFEAKEPLVCAAHVFVPLPTAASEAALGRAEAQIKALSAQWQAGQLAAGSAADLGCFRRGEMLEAIDAVAFELPVGHWSYPVRSPLGLHVVKVTEHRASPTDSCEEEATRETFRGELYQEEMQRQMVTWTEELRKKAFVEVRLQEPAEAL